LIAREAGLSTRSTDGRELFVPAHRSGLDQGVLFTRDEYLDANLSFFAQPEIAGLLARTDPR